MPQNHLVTEPKILLIGRMYHEAGEELLNEHARVTILEQPTPVEISNNIHDAAGTIVRYPSQLDANAIRRAEELLVISTSGRGTDAVDIAAATEMGIVVVNNPNLSTTAVTEHTMALILALAKNVPLLNKQVRQGNYSIRDRSSQIQLAEKTLGIIGLGHIGIDVAQKCKLGLGMRILVYDPYVDPNKAEQVGATNVANLEDLLSESDFVSLHPELNDETRGMIGEAELRKMKPTAFLINAARGKVVAEAALVRALREQWIAGAALDVFESEPPPADSPLYDFDNVILSPHVGGVIPEACRAMSLSAANQILQALHGEKPKHIVNPEVWDTFQDRIL